MDTHKEIILIWGCLTCPYPVPHPLKNHNAIGWPRAPKIHKATKRAFNAGPSNGISLVGRWWPAYSSPLINYKVTWDQKRRRNASIRNDSLFEVTLRIDCYGRVYRSFSKRYNSFSRVGFKSLQCAYDRYSSQNIAEMRLSIVIYR